jgi:hypothetical protein
MGPILSGVMAVHRSTIDHLMGRVSSIMTPETGWISLRGAEFFGLHHDGFWLLVLSAVVFSWGIGEILVL